MVECCANCKHCIPYPKNNRYRDVEYLCTKTSYFVHQINKDRNTVKRYSPGGRELECMYERKESANEIKESN